MVKTIKKLNFADIKGQESVTKRAIGLSSDSRETKSDGTHRNNSVCEQTGCNSCIECSKMVANFRAFNLLDVAVDYTTITW